MLEPKNPSDVLDSLLNATVSTQQKTKLKAIHALCDVRYLFGESDFSVPVIGRLCDSINLMNGRGLFNKSAKPYRDLIGAWAAYADPISLDGLAELPETHPDIVFRKILAKGGFSNKQRNLRLLNELCREQHAAGSLDFSLGTIGQLCQAHGFLQKDSLKNKDFGDYRTIISAWDAFVRPWHNVESPDAETTKRVQKAHDLELTWVARDHPDLAEWRSLAVEWLKGQKVGLGHRLSALTAFFNNYLLHPAVPKQPNEMLIRGQTLPDFRTTACPSSTAGVTYNNYIYEMINWVLLRDFSMPADDGGLVVCKCQRIPAYACPA